MKGVKMNGAPFGFEAGFGGSAKNAKEKSEPDSDGNICKHCGGRGRVQVFVSSGFGRIKKIQECTKCGGTGKFTESAE